VRYIQSTGLYGRVDDKLKETRLFIPKEETMQRSRPTSTIRRRIIFLNITVFAFIGLLIIAYTFQFFSIEKNLIMLEDFHDIFDNVLEIRRYEKNFLLDVGSENILNILDFLDKIDVDLKKHEMNIINVVGKARFIEFRGTLDDYRSIFTSIPSLPAFSVDDQKVRENGKKMVAFTSFLLDTKQQNIRNNFKITIFSFIAITGAFFIFIIVALQLQAKSVLDRIAFVHEATRSVVEGNFTPIVYNTAQQDEISDLIHAFNKMASELDIRQEQLIQSRKLAAIGTFSSGIAHELNNPLNNISLSADTLLEEYSTLDEEETIEIITDIITQTERATEVVKNLLDFSRDKAPSAQPLNIKAVIEKTEKLIANELRLNAIWLEDYTPDDLPRIMGDMQKLQQVFLNLFVNAIHAMPEGGLIYIDAKEEPDGYIRINVSDTGPGIKPENLERIFDPFYTTKEVGKGTGLGLSIVYGIIKKHGGYIEVKSKMNIGTTFSICLPVISRPELISESGNASSSN
jgi:two-component system NtrC family sensor kinase